MNYIRFIAFFVCFISTPSLLLAHNEAHNTHELEKEIGTIFSGSFGYTLVGDKPIAIEELFASQFIRRYNDRLMPVTVTAYLEQLFNQSSMFIFIARGNAKYQKLYLIHRDALEKCIQQEQQFLNQRLQRHVTTDWVISALKEKTNAFDAVALGVLLGYGRVNSLFYARRTELGQYLGKNPSSTPQLFEKQELALPEDLFYLKTAPQANPLFKSFEEEWQWIVRNMAPIQRQEAPFCFAPISFVAKKGAETDRIQTDFANARAKMASLFYNRPIIDCVVECAAKHHSH